MDHYQDNWGIIIVGPDTNKVSTMWVGPKLRFVGLFYESFPWLQLIIQKTSQISMELILQSTTPNSELNQSWPIFHQENPSRQNEEKMLNESTLNKLAKARKTRTSPGTLGLKKFGQGKLWVKKVFGKYTFKKYTFEKYTFRKYIFGKYTVGKYTFEKYTFGQYTFGKYTFEKYTFKNTLSENTLL